MYVFREGRRFVSAEDLRRSLAQSLAELSRLADISSALPLTIESLLRAGELECALADCAPAQQRVAASITDELAAQLVSQKPINHSAVCEVLERLPLPAEVTVSVPEGFAYYALHPLQYASLVDALAITAPAVAVV